MPDIRRTIRLAVEGASPCSECTARCCKWHGPEYAVLLTGDEARRFAPWAAGMSVTVGGEAVIETVLTYRDGRCPFLGSDDRCTIYDDRPAACRQFECTQSYNTQGVGRHGPFLRRNPEVVRLLDAMRPTD